MYGGVGVQQLSAVVRTVPDDNPRSGVLERLPVATPADVKAGREPDSADVGVSRDYPLSGDSVARYGAEGYVPLAVFREYRTVAVDQEGGVVALAGIGFGRLFEADFYVCT